jgi:hypothetical protein
MGGEADILEMSPEIEADRSKEPVTLWRWYFGWHPRLFLTVPTFLIFIYQGISYIFIELRDVIYFFQSRPVTWGAIFLIIILGSILFWLVAAPIYISFGSISWLYEINVGNYTPWKKFLYSIGIFLLVIFGTWAIRLFTSWVLGIF